MVTRDRFLDGQFIVPLLFTTLRNHSFIPSRGAEEWQKGGQETGS